LSQPGSLNDAKIWADCRLNDHLERGKLNLPETPEGTIGYHFLGDDAFPLTKRLSKPFAQRSHLTDTIKIHNYRLTKGRKVIENAFGHLANKFRLFRSPINLSLENATNVIKAATALHNFLLIEGKQEYAPGGATDCEDSQIIPGEWENSEERKNLLNIGRLAGNRSGTLENLQK
jgi:hypothetical protein